MALGSGTSFQNPFDDKDKKKKKKTNTGPSIGSTRNHPTRKGIKQRYTSKGWTNIRGDESTPSTKTKTQGRRRNVRGGDPKLRAAQKKLRQEKELARLKGGGKVGLFGVDALNRTPGRIRQLEKELGKNRKTNKKDETNNEDKNKGGKVTYRHRDTSGETGIRMSGNTVVSRSGDKNAIRNNVKADKDKQSTITKKDEKPTGTNQELDPREAKARKLEKRIERFKDTPLMKRGQHRRNLERQIRNLRKKKKKDDKKNRTGSAYVGSIHQA